MRTILVLLVLAGCSTPEQRADRAIANFGPYCERLGFKAATDQWRDCIQKAVGNQATRAGVAAQNARNTREAMKLK